MLRTLRALDLRKDLDGVARIAATCFRDELERRGTTIGATVRPLRTWLPLLCLAARFSKYVRDRMAGAVSIDDGRIASFVLMKPMGRETSQWYVGPVATDPACQRRGHGRAALEEALALARKRGAGFALLDVRDDNVAGIALYESAGFSRYDSVALMRADAIDGADEALALPAGCVLRNLRLSDWRTRHRVALAETPQAVLDRVPLHEREFRLPAWERLIPALSARISRARIRRYAVLADSLPRAWGSVRAERKGRHHIALHVALDDAEHLAAPLLDLLLSHLGTGACRSIQTRVRATAAPLVNALSSRGFRIVERYERLGRVL
jgi:ribosomal protein S18 acetylase RimI-like enzyme